MKADPISIEALPDGRAVLQLRAGALVVGLPLLAAQIRRLCLALLRIIVVEQQPNESKTQLLGAINALEGKQA